MACLRDVSERVLELQKSLLISFLCTGNHRCVFFAGAKMPFVLKLDECQIVKG